MKNRTSLILNRFITSEYPIRLESLGDEFNISSRTIRNELKEINEFLVQEDLPEIQNIRGKGFMLTLSTQEKERLVEYSVEDTEETFLNREERIFDLILSFSLGSEKVLLYQKEEEFLISKSTMDEDMRRVRAILETYGIEVMSIPKQGIVLHGAERSIRTMTYDIINRSVGIIDISEQTEAVTMSQKILFKYIPLGLLKKIDAIYDRSVSSVEENVYRNQLLMFTAVWLKRFRQQNLIASSSWENIDSPQNDIRDFVNLICEEFGLHPPVIEIKYIVFILDTFNSRDMNNSIEWVQAQLLSIQLIQFVEQETKIPFSRKEEVLQEGLYKHLIGLLNRIKSDIQIVNPLRENIRKNYGNIYHAIKKFAPEINRVTGKGLNEDEIAFLTIHFSTSVSEINQDLQFVYKAVVVCNHGMATGKLLSENLKELFNIEVVAVLSSREIGLISKLDVDLVFATLPIRYFDKPVLVLEPIIKEDSKKLIQNFLDKNSQFKRLIHNNESTQLFHSVLKIVGESGGEVTNAIYNKMEALFEKNHLRINKREIQPMLNDVLKDSNILLKEQANDWEDAIIKVSQPLLKEEVIDQNYVQAMIDSVKEFGPYIVIGKHLALAHARPEDGVNKLGLSVATLKEPIEFGNDSNDPVKIIFCLAAIDSYSHLNVMKSLIDLINDEEKVAELCEATELEEFKAILFG